MTDRSNKITVIMMSWDKPYRRPQNQRLDAALYSDPGRVCFFTLRAYRRRSPFTNASLNLMIIDTLREEQERQDCEISVYCLMPDHLHFLIRPRREGVSVLKFTDQFKGKTTNRSWRLGWGGKLWQQRYYDHIIRRDESLRAIAEYILANPVRASLVETPDQWDWSGVISPLPL